MYRVDKKLIIFLKTFDLLVPVASCSRRKKEGNFHCGVQACRAHALSHKTWHYFFLLYLNRKRECAVQVIFTETKIRTLAKILRKGMTKHQRRQSALYFGKECKLFSKLSYYPKARTP
jgi:hypothetical protein